MGNDALIRYMLSDQLKTRYSEVFISFFDWMTSNIINTSWITAIGKAKGYYSLTIFATGFQYRYFSKISLSNDYKEKMEKWILEYVKSKNMNINDVKII